MDQKQHLASNVSTVSKTQNGCRGVDELRPMGWGNVTGRGSKALNVVRKLCSLRSCASFAACLAACSGTTRDPRGGVRRRRSTGTAVRLTGTEATAAEAGGVASPSVAASWAGSAASHIFSCLLRASSAACRARTAASRSAVLVGAAGAGAGGATDGATNRTPGDRRRSCTAPSAQMGGRDCR